MSYRGGDRGRGRGTGGPARGGGRGGRGGSPSSGPGQERSGVFSPGTQANIDSRLTDGSEAVLVQSFRALKINSNELPLRPGFGALGTPVKLRANFFPVKIPKRVLHEYEVAITPTAGTANRRVKRRIFQLAEQTPDWASNNLRGQVAHDHASKLIGATLLPQPLIIRVPFFDEDEDGPTPNSREYVLSINFIQNIDTSHLLSYLSGQKDYRGYDILPIISALNLILAAHPNRTTDGGGVLVGRNRFFFASAAPPVPLGGGLEAWRGFYSSVRPTYNQLMVNVNVCTTAFYIHQNLADAMTTFGRASYGARYTAFAKGVRIKALHLGYKKTVKSVSNLTPSQHKFDCSEFGGMISVEAYFLRKYGVRLKHPHLPLVDVGGQKANLLPPELCEILPNQPFKGRLSDECTSVMITAAAKPPNVNAQTIVFSGLNSLGFRTGSGAPPSALNAFEVSVGNEMTIVPGRILTPPSVVYSVGRPRMDTEKASWNLRDVKFLKCGHLTNWIVFCIVEEHGRHDFAGPGDPDLRKTIQEFSKILQSTGVKVDQPSAVMAAKLPPKDSDDPIRSKAIEAIRSSFLTAKQKPSFALVILSNNDKNVYAGIKYLCDSWLDFPTVCAHAEKIRKCSPAYFGNIALKINIKLGGANHSLDKQSMAWLNQKSTMLVGIDVTHPGPGSVKGTPSIAAVVASVDANYAQYPASMQLQESKKEMVTNLASMMVERLELYKKRNRSNLPERIVVYRDGVSEGQLPIVVAEEMPAIRAAFRKFDSTTQKYNPKLSIIVCGKRHHTRFYPTDAQGADQNGNPKPGMVVDRGVVAIFQHDFYLQAHAGLKGTTRPTHYYVVHDDNSFKADELQTLTNHISYLYSRATKAVSLASPAYYADMACERGRCYIHKLLHNITNVNLNIVNADQEVMKEAHQMWHNGVAGELKESMFYL